MNVWLRESGIPGILVELSTPWSPEVDRNLSARAGGAEAIGRRCNVGTCWFERA